MVDANETIVNGGIFFTLFTLGSPIYAMKIAFYYGSCALGGIVGVLDKEKSNQENRWKTQI